MDTMTISINDLPKILILKGKNGEKKLYKINPSGRKFGICLNAVDAELEEFFLQIDK